MRLCSSMLRASVGMPLGSLIIEFRLYTVSFFDAAYRSVTGCNRVRGPVNTGY